MKLSRRVLLRSSVALGLSAGLAPLARGLLGQARAAEAGPVKRLILIVTGNALEEHRYQATARSETDWDLPPVFAPVSAYKPDMLLLSKFYNPFDIDLHGNGWATLSCLGSNDDGLPGGITLDRLLARRIGSEDAFTSLNLAAVYQKADPIHRSADGRGAAYPAEISPVRAFTQVFGDPNATPDGQDPEEAARALFARRKSVLDFVTADISRFSSRLNGFEREKLDQYTASIRKLEQTLGKFSTGTFSCNQLQAPQSHLDGDLDDDGDLDATYMDDATVEAHLSLAHTALACGVTKIATVNLGNSGGKISHYGISALTNGGSHHVYCHENNQAALDEIHTYIFSKVAGLLQRLHETPDGDGTLADSTLVLLVNDGGGSHHNGTTTIPIVMFGSLGGHFRTGRYLEFASEQHCVSDVFTSVVNAFGVDVPTFGDPSVCKGPLPNLI